MSDQPSLHQRLDKLLTHYGPGSDGSAPNAAQWAQILQRNPDQPITLINFFKLHDQALYPAPSGLAGSGQDAFDRYAAVSIPTVEKVGGHFLLIAPFEGMFVGMDEDWDVIAIGAYPSTSALLALFEDAAYQACFFHRTAACARQKVFLCAS